MLRLFSRKKTKAPRAPTEDSEELIADLKLQLLRTEKERDVAMSKKEADEEQLDKLREKVRELACELQDAKDLMLNERSLRESTLSVEAIAVIELNDEIAACHTQIRQLRFMLKNVCESKRKALSIQLSVLNDRLQRSEYLRREANRRWRSAEISATEWRKRALTSEKLEYATKYVRMRITLQ
uniref:Tropomyosin n=1 Tax=Parascaris univalens TaxID=6257 RepID=A0A914ZND9_PARUN